MALKDSYLLLSSLTARMVCNFWNLSISGIVFSIKRERQYCEDRGSVTMYALRFNLDHNNLK